MTKRAVILHGTEASPQDNWFPWLKSELVGQGYDVWVPLLPGNERPSKQIYNDFIFNSDWDLTNNLVIGHSSGAVAILNLLADDRCPHFDAAVLVSAWSSGLPEKWQDETQFDELFPKEGFDYKKIKAKADRFLLVQGEADEYCPVPQAMQLANELSAQFSVVSGGDHLGANYPVFTELVQSMQAFGMLPASES